MSDEAIRKIIIKRGLCKMSIVKLPLAESPIIGLQYIAYTLGIVLNDEESLPWYYSNYIQLVSGNTFLSAMHFYPAWYHTIPFLIVQAFKKEITKFGNINIHKFIKDCIDNQLYFYSVFDEFYVPRRLSYGRRHFQHDFLIYGYDEAQQEYILAGFDENRFYRTTTVSFAQFEEAFFSEMNEYVHLLKRNEGLKYNFNLKRVCELLEDYLYRRNTSERYSDGTSLEAISDRHWGLDVYKHLRGYFNSLINGDAWYDIRPLHILYEHKKCMVSRLEYMEKNNYISDCSYLIDSYKILENKSMVMRNLQLKYSATSDKKYLRSIVETLAEIEQKEEELLEILIDKIRKKLA